MKKEAARLPEKKKAPLYKRIRLILESARTSVARTVNTAQVVANWLIGREIVEEEQSGRRRAGYGQRLLPDLSARLSRDYGCGYSVDNLEAFRQFYLEYPRLIPETLSRISDRPVISETVSRKSRPAEWSPGMLHPTLSWSELRELGTAPRRGRKP